MNNKLILLGLLAISGQLLSAENDILNDKYIQEFIQSLVKEGMEKSKATEFVMKLFEPGGNFEPEDVDEYNSKEITLWEEADKGPEEPVYDFEDFDDELPPK